ncbi:uncharacterized protein LOC126981407 [Eriocheir sinensis]|uniref:uncharacterized protein LOC126981407 n=1 Tax=Eriocheir sinensis TaxID=95602 RepID=UPI0021C84C39|nr:uncharacterized protein LOC126981407 [Eriocheir sinensis]
MRGGHSARDCRGRRFCRICKGRHPTVLHRETSDEGKVTQSNENDVSTPSESNKQTEHNDQAKQVRVNTGRANRSDWPDKLSIIPVKVRCANGDLIPTHAFIDNGSTATFCTRDLLGKLTHRDVRPTQIRLSTMQADDIMLDSEIVSGIEICDLNENNFVSLPPMYTVDKIPVSRENIIRNEDLEDWAHLRSINLPELEVDIGLLLGINVPQALEPMEVIPSTTEGGPFATRTRLGWVVFGPSTGNAVKYVRVNRVNIEDVTLDHLLINIYNQEFIDVNSTKKGPSEEDRCWMAKVEESCRLTDVGHYEIGMPFKDQSPMLPNNRKSVVKRLEGLRKRLERDERFHKDYCEFMSNIIQMEYAEEVPAMQLVEPKAWYIPHHGVYHHQKTDQLRVVFDCAAKYQGTSLNDVLLQGPDLTNPLVEVLIKFRQYPFAYMADIKSMFYQVLVPEKDRDYLRFLWWKDGNVRGELREYRMTVHPFGAKSSPSCANYALRRTVTDHDGQHSLEAQGTILHNFYVDDCLKSADTEEELVKLAHEVQGVCSKGGFELAKFVSNSRDLLASLPVEDRGKKVKELDLHRDSLPSERALGTCWNIELDSLTVSVHDKDKPLTRRGILSTIGAMYDPLEHKQTCGIRYNTHATPRPGMSGKGTGRAEQTQPRQRREVCSSPRDTRSKETSHESQGDRTRVLDSDEPTVEGAYCC